MAALHFLHGNAAVFLRILPQFRTAKIFFRTAKLFFLTGKLFFRTAKVQEPQHKYSSFSPRGGGNHGAYFDFLTLYCDTRHFIGAVQKESLCRI